MTEWWTYRPSDFLMFSPRVHARLIEALKRGERPAPGSTTGRQTSAPEGGPLVLIDVPGE